MGKKAFFLAAALLACAYGGNVSAADHALDVSRPVLDQGTDYPVWDEGPEPRASHISRDQAIAISQPVLDQGADYPVWNDGPQPQARKTSREEALKLAAPVIETGN